MEAESNFLFPRPVYWTLFTLLGVVYLIGLFVPLLDNDSAHHANIALRMYLTGDYASLVDEGKDYLDKPHLLFWSAAAGYHLFGVNSFAYKFPSLLFTIGGLYSTYRLGKGLYGAEIGKLAALVIASAFAFILSNNDVRMEAILTASIAFATWQLVDWAHSKRLLHAIGAGLGLALAFSTKGMIGVFIPAIGIFFYLLYRKEWKSFYHVGVLLITVSFFVFISPVLYCYYLQYDLHPEKIIRGKTGWSGVKFILWQQTFERYEGKSFGGAGSKDYFFFFHSFLWAFAPWSVIAYIAIINRISTFTTRKGEWLTTATVIVMAILITFSGFKLPHYVNIIFPAASVLTAAFVWEKAVNSGWGKKLLVIQMVVCGLCLAVALLVNAWAFPVTSWLVVAAAILLLVACVFVYRSVFSKVQKAITISVLTSAFVFFLLNSNFYPRLLTYQGGNQLAFATRKKINPKHVFIWPGIYNPSYQFYTKELKKDFTDSVLLGYDTVWVFTDRPSLPRLKEKGLPVWEQYVHHDYNIGTMSLRFINPSTRKNTLDSLYLVRVK